MYNRKDSDILGEILEENPINEFFLFCSGEGNVGWIFGISYINPHTLY